MIGLKMTYYPPSAANEEPISIERTLTIRAIMDTPGILEATASQLYSALVDNSEELQEIVYAAHTEYEARTNILTLPIQPLAKELFEHIRSDEAFDLIQISKD